MSQTIKSSPYRNQTFNSGISTANSHSSQQNSGYVFFVPLVLPSKLEEGHELLIRSSEALKKFENFLENNLNHGAIHNDIFFYLRTLYLITKDLLTAPNMNVVYHFLVWSTLTLTYIIENGIFNFPLDIMMRDANNSVAAIICSPGSL